MPVYEEIDMRPYIQVLLTRWWQIAAASIICGVLAYSAMLFVAPSYESTALVIVAKPRFNLQFDSRIQTPDPSYAFLAYPTLALSDAVLGELKENLNLENVVTLDDVRGLVAAQNGSDPSLIELTVTYTDPTVAADITNKWSEIFINRANHVYGNQGDESTIFLQGQLTRAKIELDTINAELATFQAQYSTQSLSTELAGQLATQAAYLTQKRQTADLQRDVAAYALQLATRSAGDVLTTSDATALMFLQARGFGVEVSTAVNSSAPLAVPDTSLLATASINTPFWLDLSGGIAGLTGASVVEGASVLNDLQMILDGRLALIEEQLTALEPQILATQALLQNASNDESLLQSQQELAFSTYKSLSTALDEVLITSQDTTGQVRLASLAAVPDKPAGPKKLLNTAVAALVGLFVGFAWVFGRVWWAQGLIQPNSRIN